MKPLVSLALLLLSAPALAQSFTFEADCIPGGAVTLDASEAVLVDGGATWAEYAIPPITTPGGTFGYVFVEETAGYAHVGFFDDPDVSDLALQVVGPPGTIGNLSVPSSIDLSTYFYAYSYYDASDGACSLTGVASVPTAPRVHNHHYEAACMPDGAVDVDLRDAVLTEVSGPNAYWAIPPLVTSAGTYNVVQVHDADDYDAVSFLDDVNDPNLQMDLVGPPGLLEGLSIPGAVDLSDWFYANGYYDEVSGSCGFTEASAQSGDLFGLGISAAAGFESVMDSGPTRLGSTWVASQLESLEAEAEALGCTATPLAGTWERDRSPRLSGLAADGRAIEGASITEGTLGDASFTASLARGGALTGTTDAGGTIEGLFVRLSPQKVVWYGVESVCLAAD